MCTSVKTLRNLLPLPCSLSLFPWHAQADMQVFIVFVCLRVSAVESACGVFVSRSERPAPVINGVPVWGTARRRTQSLGQTAAPPGLSFTWGEEKGGKEGGWRGNYSLAVLTLSFLSSAHPSCFSLLKRSTPTPSSVLSLSVGPCPPFNLICGTSTCTHVHTCDVENTTFWGETRREKVQRKIPVGGKDKVNCQHNTSWALKKKLGWRARSPLWIPLPPPTFPSLRFGYAAPLLSVKQAF